MIELNTRSACRSKLVRSDSGRWRISRAHIIGTRVRDTTAEITMVTVSVMANSWNRRRTGDVAHEQQRYEHRDERNRQ